MKKQKKTVFGRVGLLYDILKKFRGRQIKSLNIEECKMIIDAYGDLTEELKRERERCDYYGIRKVSEKGWQEVLMDKIGEDIIGTDYI